MKKITFFHELQHRNQYILNSGMLEGGRQCTEVRFASFLSGGFTTMPVINPPERKRAKRTSVH